MLGQQTNAKSGKTVLVQGVGDPEDGRLLVGFGQESVGHGLNTEVLAEHVMLLVTVLNEVPTTQEIGQFFKKGLSTELQKRFMLRDQGESVHETRDVKRDVLSDGQVTSSVNGDGTLEGVVDRVALRIGARLATA